MTSLTDDLNQDMYKENAIFYESTVKQIIRTIIKKCPRNILIEVLKSEKIISKDWLQKGNKYTEYKKS